MSFDQDPNEQADISGADLAIMIDHVKELEQQNLALLAALSLWKVVSDNAEESELDDMACYCVPMPLFCDASEATEEALAIQPSADLLAERDRKRDAALIRSIRFPTMLRKMWSGSEVQKFLKDKAEARLDGTWEPKL